MSSQKTKIHQKCLNLDCGFEGNPAEAIFCQICLTPLDIEQHHKPVKPSLQLSWKMTVRMLLLGVLLASGGWYLLSQRDRSLSISPETKSVSSVSSESSTSDIKIYPTIKDVPNVPSGTFTYGGSICFAALEREGLHEAISKAHPQFRLKYVEPEDNPGCSGGVKQLLNQGLSFAQNARLLTLQELQLAKSKEKNLEIIEVGSDGIVFYVNNSVPVNFLSLEQLKDIYSGKITDWQQLGLSNFLPVTPISLEPKTNQELSLLMGQDAVISDRVQIVRDHTTAVRKVASIPGAIAPGSAAILRGQKLIRPIPIVNESENAIPLSILLSDDSVNLDALRRNSYSLIQQMYVVILRDGSIDEKAGVAYANFLLSQEGQEIIKKAGFLPKFWEE